MKRKISKLYKNYFIDFNKYTIFTDIKNSINKITQNNTNDSINETILNNIDLTNFFPKIRFTVDI